MFGLSGLDGKLSEPGRVLEFILLTGYVDFSTRTARSPTGCNSIICRKPLQRTVRSLKRYSRRHSPSTRRQLQPNRSRPVRVARPEYKARWCKRSWTIWKGTTATPRCHSKAWRPNYLFRNPDYVSHNQFLQQRATVLDYRLALRIPQSAVASGERRAAAAGSRAGGLQRESSVFLSTCSPRRRG